MKTTYSLLIGALIIISGIMVFLLKNGISLRPAGVIKPSEIGLAPDLIGRSVGQRLFPDFNSVKHVVWYLENSNNLFERIPVDALANFKAPQKPTLVDLRTTAAETCQENCWFVLTEADKTPALVQQKTASEPSLIIYVQFFDRNESVPAACEIEKVLDVACVKPVSVREVRRKIKTSAPHFFMRRYLENQFYLFIER